MCRLLRRRNAWLKASQQAPPGVPLPVRLGPPRTSGRCLCWRGEAASAPLAGLVVPGRLPGDDVQAVVEVDEGDEGHQRRELVVVVVLGRVRPGLVGDPAGGVGDAGALLG